MTHRPSQRAFVRALFDAMPPHRREAVAGKEPSAYEDFASHVLAAFREGLLLRTSNKVQSADTDYVRRLIYDGFKKKWLKVPE